MADQGRYLPDPEAGARTEKAAVPAKAEAGQGARLCPSTWIPTLVLSRTELERSTNVSWLTSGCQLCIACLP
jgi:hypothetical protein